MKGGGVRRGGEGGGELRVEIAVVEVMAVVEDLSRTGYPVFCLVSAGQTKNQRNESVQMQ